jgi:hypothetical protein
MASTLILALLVCAVGLATFIAYCAGEGKNAAELGRFLTTLATALTLFVLMTTAAALLDICEERIADLQRLVVCSTEQKPGTNPACPSTQGKPSARFLLEASGGALLLVTIILLILTICGLVVTAPPFMSEESTHHHHTTGQTGAYTGAVAMAPPPASTATPTAPPHSPPATPAPPHTSPDLQSALADTQAELISCKGRVSGLEWSFQHHCPDQHPSPLNTTMELAYCRGMVSGLKEVIAQQKQQLQGNIEHGAAGSNSPAHACGLAKAPTLASQAATIEAGSSGQQAEVQATEAAPSTAAAA